MDPRSGTLSSNDPVVASASDGRSTQPANAESPSRDPTQLTPGSGTTSPDPSSSCSSGTTSKSVEPTDFKQVPDAPSTSSSSSKATMDRPHKTSTSSSNRKNHHSPGAESRSSLQKSSQPTRSSAQSRNVQWVRVSPQNPKTSDSSAHDTRDSGKQLSSGSLPTSVPQNEFLSSSDTSQQAVSSSTLSEKQAPEDTKLAYECKARPVSEEKQAPENARGVNECKTEFVSEKQATENGKTADESKSLSISEIQATENTKAVDEHKTESPTDISAYAESFLLVSGKSHADESSNPGYFKENPVQETTAENKATDSVPQDMEARLPELAHEAANADDGFVDSLCQAITEQLTPSAMNAESAEDEDTCEPHQRVLSRTSSLSAKAMEFVPKSATPPPTAPTLPPQPPQVHVVPPPLMISLNATPGILPMFPPSSPLPSPQLGGFPLPMVGPPPPPIPASIMGPMPLLGSPHPGLLNIGPPPPVIPPPSYLIHSPSPIVPPHQLHPLPLNDPLIETLQNQCVKHNGDALQEQNQPQELDLSAAQPGLTKSMLTEDLRAKIVKQVEYYFSDTNLPTDYHLMKFVKKDPEGFVPIPLVANFRKVKNLTKSHALVATALSSSKQLVVSLDGKKVRRLHPLPHIDYEEIQSRTVVAENLPPDYSIESMQLLFGSVGNVRMVRICEPEAANGAYQAKLSKADVVVSNKLHALVEYDTVEQAERAVAELTDQGNWRRGLSVRLLVRRTTKHAPSKSYKLNEGTDGSATEDDASDNVAPEKTREDEQIQDRPDEHSGCDHLQNDASKKGRGRGRARGRGRGHHPNGGRSHPVGTPPQANSLNNFEPKPPLGPRMPDGTRGFAFGRGKVMPTNSV